ncbi:hypothetical protein HZS_1290, partial [Henneguya salminicola]
YQNIILLRTIINSNLSDWSNKNKDDDVHAENIFTTNTENNNKCHLILKNVDKNYRIGIKLKKLPVVKNLSFALRKGECFGLLGVNGAGKSTTFKMIVKETQVSAGKIIKMKTKGKTFLSYCPQTDNLDMHMTPRESIEYLCQLCGYSNKAIKYIIENLLIHFGLTKFENYLIKNMSFGNRRKLSCALCVIGDPTMILLDEPTSGVDPSARKLIWNFIFEINKMGKSIIFTSHCMKECEIYSERIAIMVQGEIRCLGTPEHIKEKCGLGYELKLKISDQFSEEVQMLIKGTFSDCKIYDSISSLNCLIPLKYDRINEIFALIKMIKSIDSSLQYTVNQSSLENVFYHLKEEKYNE